MRDNNQINETIKLKEKFKCARDAYETIKYRRNLRVREILTKQSNNGEILECARY